MMGSQASPRGGAEADFKAQPYTLASLRDVDGEVKHVCTGSPQKAKETDVLG